MLPAKPGGARPPADEGGSLLDGLGGLLNRFRQAGQGKAADSWVGTGSNEPVSPGQVGSALGPNILKTLAERSGMSEEDSCGYYRRFCRAWSTSSRPRAGYPPRPSLTRCDDGGHLPDGGADAFRRGTRG
ncbi:MAG: YidB family protein [Rhodoplanes sp.]